MWLYDKVKNIFSKPRGDSRLSPRASGYSHHGASYAKKALLGWMASGCSADEDITDNLQTLRARARDLYMGSPLATGALKTIRTNVVGGGLKLNSQIDAGILGLSPDDAAEKERKIEREWELWAGTTSCDAARQCTFGQLQGLVLLSAIMSGDVFVSLPIVPRAGELYDLRLAVIEGDRICDPIPKPPEKNIVEGVEIGRYGDPVAYYVAKNHPGSIPRAVGNFVQEWKRVLAFGARTGRKNILHIFSDIERPGQRRGNPLLAPVMESLKQLSRYTDAELMAAVVAGMFTVFVKSDSPESPLVSSFPPEARIDDDPAAYELGNGSIVSLAENESIETANPGRPNVGFDAFVIAICRQIGAAIELPYELLVKNFTSSYSASRGALLEAWKMFRMRRRWMVDSFCQPVYEEWLSEAVAKGRIDAPGFFEDPVIRRAWCSADWCGPSQGQLDPLKEVRAAKIRVEEFFSTRTREAAELTGMSYENIAHTRELEELRRPQNFITEDENARLFVDSQD